MTTPVQSTQSSVQLYNGGLAYESLDEVTQTQGASRIERHPIVKEEALNKEATRSSLAKALLALLAVSLVGIGIYIFLPKQNSAEDKTLHRELMTIVWTSQVTLVSGALGYYFGSENES